MPVNPETETLALLQMQWWLLSGVAAILLGLWIRMRSRRRPMAQLAAQLDLHGPPSGAGDVLERFAGLEVLNQGHARRAVDVFEGSSAGRPLCCFRFITELGSRTSRRVEHRFVVVVETATPFFNLHLGRTPPPPLFLDPGLRRLDLPAPSTPGSDLDVRLYAPACDAATPRGDTLHTLHSWCADQPAGPHWQCTPTTVCCSATYGVDVAVMVRMVRATLELCTVVERHAAIDSPPVARRPDPTWT